MGPLLKKGCAKLSNCFTFYNICIMKKITHIIFDFGAVIINIDYDTTIQAFKNLGIKNSEKLYSKKIQNKLFEQLEEGKISNQNFIDEIKSIFRLGERISDTIEDPLAKLGVSIDFSKFIS